LFYRNKKDTACGHFLRRIARQSYLCGQDVRAVCESFANMRGLPNYPHGIIFTFWEQYVSLRFYLTMAVVAALAAVFVTLAVVLLNVVAAFLVVW